MASGIFTVNARFDVMNKKGNCGSTVEATLQYKRGNLRAGVAGSEYPLLSRIVVGADGRAPDSGERFRRVVASDSCRFPCPELKPIVSFYVSSNKEGLVIDTFVNAVSNIEEAT
jgi:hypothetical protein